VANTWSDISTALAATATSYTNGVTQQTRDWQGSAADAYRTQAGKLVQALGGAAALADAMNNISLIGAEIVATVRGTVRDTISTLIGFLADLAIEEACSVGLATPVVIAQGVKDIGEAAKEIAEAIDDACTMLGVALGLAAKANTMWAEIIKVMPNLEATIGNIGVAAQAHSPTNR
jgi:phage-related protein